MKKKKLYISLTADTIHHGHIKLVEKAREFGDITIGLMTSRQLLNLRGYQF